MFLTNKRHKAFISVVLFVSRIQSVFDEVPDSLVICQQPDNGTKNR